MIEIEKHLYSFINNIYLGLQRYICPNTYIVLRYKPDSTIVAYTINNVIYYNLGLIMNRYRELINTDINLYILQTKRFIIEVLIHEMYHIEQDIIKIVYEKNKDYRNSIEASVIFNTLIFQLQYNAYIEYLTGVQLDLQTIQERFERNFNSYTPIYTRQTDTNSYFLNLFQKIFRYDINNYSFYMNNINEIKNLVLEVNGSRYIIKSNYIFNNNYNELNTITNRFFQCNNINFDIESIYNSTMDMYIIKISDHEDLLFKKGE